MEASIKTVLQVGQTAMAGLTSAAILFSTAISVKRGLEFWAIETTVNNLQSIVF